MTDDGHITYGGRELDTDALRGLLAERRTKRETLARTELDRERARIWRESAEKYRRATEQDRCAACGEFHARMSALHAALADDHAQQAAKLAGTEDTDLD